MKGGLSPFGEVVKERFASDACEFDSSRIGSGFGHVTKPEKQLQVCSTLCYGNDCLVYKYRLNSLKEQCEENIYSFYVNCHNL
jgi:hypothetical protein